MNYKICRVQNILLSAIMIIFVVIFFISSYILLKEWLETKENNEYTEKIIKEAVITTMDANNQKLEESKIIDWDYLKSVNTDIIGWIEIEETNINYPILQDNNLYYLNYTYNGKYNKNGSIFTTNENPFNDEETIIYGHNMRNETMFSELGKYLDKDFLNTHKQIKIYTPDGNYEGIILGAYSTSVETETKNTKSLDFNERLEYYKKASSCTLEDKYSIEKIVKLVTCSYINAKATPTEQRYYVIAGLKPSN